MLFDLGVSSMQLDVRERGFAYAEDAPLDMRMDADDRADRGRRAQHLLGRRADPGAAGVRRGAVRPQDRRPPSSAVASRRRSRRRRGWSSCSTTRSPRRPAGPADTPPSAPSRRCGWRSTTSSRVLRRAIPAAIDAIAVGGRVVVESYHSLEDRLVKQAFTEATRSDGAGGPAVRARGQRAGAAAGDPRRRAGRRSRDRAEPARRLGAAARRRTRQSRFPGSRSMSALPAIRPARARPRFAEAAVERARLTVVPRPPPGPGAAGAVRDPGQPGAARRRRRPALLQHPDAAGVVRRHARSRSGRQPQRPRADPARRAPGAPRPAARRDARRRRPAWSPRRRLHPAARGGAAAEGTCTPAARGNTPNPLLARRRPSRRSSTRHRTWSSVAAPADPKPENKHKNKNQQARDTGRG